MQQQWLKPPVQHLGLLEEEEGESAEAEPLVQHQFRLKPPVQHLGLLEEEEEGKSAEVDQHLNRRGEW